MNENIHRAALMGNVSLLEREIRNGVSVDLKGSDVCFFLFSSFSSLFSFLEEKKKKKKKKKKKAGR